MGLTPPRLTPERYGDFFSGYCRTSPLLVSDYDGTLAPFRKERDKALPDPHAKELLISICDAGGKLVILSGRSSEEVRSLLSVPVEIWGCHGMERLTVEGVTEKKVVPPEAVNKLQNFIPELAGFPEGSVEIKPSGAALHWRKNEKAAERYSQISKKIITAANKAGLRILSFDGGIEFTLPYFTKGTALKEIYREHSPVSPVCYMGDDITDEDAFIATKEIPGGVGILVFDRLRESGADICIHSSERNTFLEFWLNEMTKKGEGRNETK